MPGGKKRLVEATNFPVIDDGDVWYMHAATSIWRSLDCTMNCDCTFLFHASLRFIVTVMSVTHHCTLYNWVRRASSTTRRKPALVCLYLYSYTRSTSTLAFNLLCPSSGSYGSRSSKCLLFNVLWVQIDLWGTAFSCSAPRTWNKSQKRSRSEYTRIYRWIVSIDQASLAWSVL